MWTWCFLSSNLGAKGGKNNTLDWIQLEKNCKKNKAQRFYFPKRLNLDGQRWWCPNGQRHPLGKCQMCLKLISPVIHEYSSLGWGILIDVYFQKARHNKTYQFKFSDRYDDVNLFPTGFTLFMCITLFWAQSLSCVRLFATPWTVAQQGPCPWDSPGKNTGVGCHVHL